MGTASDAVAIRRRIVRGNRVLSLDGTLDSTSYLTVRDAVIVAALEEPISVIVDVTALSVPDPSAWSALRSARWHVSVWPGVPVHIVGDGITSLDDALATAPVVDRRWRRRASVELPAVPGSLPVARTLVDAWLTHWRQTPFVNAARTVTSVLMENAIGHCGVTATLGVRYDVDAVAVTLADICAATPVRHEADMASRRVGGLDFLQAASQSWGWNPTSTGKVVWAVIGPENCF